MTFDPNRPSWRDHLPLARLIGFLLFVGAAAAMGLYFGEPEALYVILPAIFIAWWFFVRPALKAKREAKRKARVAAGLEKPTYLDRMGALLLMQLAPPDERTMWIRDEPVALIVLALIAIGIVVGVIVLNRKAKERR